MLLELKTLPKTKGKGEIWSHLLRAEKIQNIRKLSFPLKITKKLGLNFEMLMFFDLGIPFSDIYPAENLYKHMHFYVKEEKAG